MADLRIFTYLPNPRIWKATIAARLNGVEIEVRGAKPHELPDWLWDFDARPLNADDRTTLQVTNARIGFSGGLVKTDAFLTANPFGTVPVAFSPDGKTGIFESNAIMRAVARLGEARVPLYGGDAYEAGRIDAFLDASLVFARASQHYLLALSGGSLGDEDLAKTKSELDTYLSGIQQALDGKQNFLVGDRLSLADICFACEMAQFSRERGAIAKQATSRSEPLLDKALAQYPRAAAHFARLQQASAFSPDFKPFMDRLTELEDRQSANSA